MPTESKMPNYGGQALMEGVLMRGSKYVAMAVRSPEGQILRHVEKLEGIYTTNIKKWPFVRGVVALWDALGLGMRFLTMSANVQTDEDEDIEGPCFSSPSSFPSSWQWVFSSCFPPVSATS